MTRKGKITRLPAVGLTVLLLALIILFMACGTAIMWLMGGDMTMMGNEYWPTVGALVLNTAAFGMAGLISKPFITGSLAPHTPSRLNGSIVFSIVIMSFVSQPIIEWASYVNYSICQSEWLLPYVGEPDHSQDEILASVMKFDTATGWATTIAVIALLPAICEETLFRWAMLPSLRRLFGGWHSAIIVTAVAFSAMHLDVYGFLPRLIMGGLLGVLFMLTRNIWAPILLHTLNNLMVVVVIGTSDKSVADSMLEAPEHPGLLLPVLCTGLLLYEILTIDCETRIKKFYEEVTKNIHI